jgi:hypothetical protein
MNDRDPLARMLALVALLLATIAVVIALGINQPGTRGPRGEPGPRGVPGRTVVNVSPDR